VTARFVFRLEPVLELRERREELAQGELARAIGALAAQQEAAIAAEREVEARLAAMRGLQGGVVEIARLRAAHDGLQHARRVADHERQGVAHMEAVAADRQGDLVRASQDREALARLRRRQLADHEQESRRREAVVLDEIGLRRHMRARLGPVPGTASA
jgi:flagellar export protein FliJ